MKSKPYRSRTDALLARLSRASQRSALLERDAQALQSGADLIDLREPGQREAVLHLDDRTAQKLGIGPVYRFVVC